MTEAYTQSNYVLFGPVVTSWTAEGLQDLQASLHQDASLSFLRQALTDLPSFITTLQREETASLVSKLEHLQELADFASGQSILDCTALSNVHIAPLTVIYQAVEFIRSTGLTEASSTLPKLQGVQGFCLGFLSAAATASSKSWEELQHNFTTSIRLAALIGAVIESDLLSHKDGLKSLSIRWKTDGARIQADACLDLFPDVSSKNPTHFSAAFMLTPHFRRLFHASQTKKA